MANHAGSHVRVTLSDDADSDAVAEQLTTVGGSLPDEVTPTLAPDATALGQIYYYNKDYSSSAIMNSLRRTLSSRV